MTEQDFAEVKLLEAILHGTLEPSHDWFKSFDRTLALYYKALGMDRMSPSSMLCFSYAVCVCVNRAESK